VRDSSAGTEAAAALRAPSGRRRVAPPARVGRTCMGPAKSRGIKPRPTGLSA
jgi:hypothetical protein